MFEPRTTDDLVRIAMAGGGFELGAAARTTDDLMRIGMAAAHGNARVTFTGMAPRTTDDLVRIGMAGKGMIVFKY